MNNTDETITHKVWSIDVDAVKANHFPMLKSHNIPTRYVMDYESYSRNSNKGHAEFDTSNSEQEVILKLLYGSDLLLMTVAVSAPHSIIQVV